MNKLFLKLSTLSVGLMLAVGAGVGLSSHKDTKSVSAATTWEKATSISVGDTVALVCENYTKELSGINNSNPSKPFGSGVAYSTLPSGAFPLTVVEGSTSGKFSFQNGTSYLNIPSDGNYLNLSSSISAASSWTVTFSDGNAVITNVSYTSRVIKWNNGSPRFASYTSGQTSVQLYKQVETGTLDSVEIRGNITNDQYVGAEWDVSELTVYAIYSNDSEIDVTNEVTMICNPTMPTALGAQSFTVDVTYEDVAAPQREFEVTVKNPVLTGTDVIVATDLVATTTTYKDFSGVSKATKAIYAGNSAKTSAGGVQFRTNNSNSGIISTKSGGKRVKSVSIVKESGTPSVQIYGSNVAYSGTDASALYNDDTKGTLVDTLTTSKTSVNFSDDYKYVGIRSENGAIYLTSITIVWELYTAEEIASNIKTMAGGWDNIAETENCGSNYASAKGMILTLSDDELNTFQTSNDTEIKSARETYETWCDRNGDVNPYNGSIVSSSQIAAQSSSVDSSALVLVIVIIASASLCSISLLLVFKRKRNK